MSANTLSVTHIGTNPLERLIARLHHNEALRLAIAALRSSYPEREPVADVPQISTAALLGLYR